MNVRFRELFGTLIFDMFVLGRFSPTLNLSTSAQNAVQQSNNCKLNFGKESALCSP